MSSSAGSPPETRPSINPPRKRGLVPEAMIQPPISRVCFQAKDDLRVMAIHLATRLER